MVKNKFSRKCVFFDRDGVLNDVIMRRDVSSPPWDISEIVIDEHAVELLNWLARRGWMTAVITNQPDARRGHVHISKLMEIESFFIEHLPVDGYFACYHDDRDGCDCRKPKIGSFKKASQQLRIDLAQSIFIGDRTSDYGASVSAGVAFIGRMHYHSDLLRDGSFPIINSLLEVKEILGDQYEHESVC